MAGQKLTSGNVHQENRVRPDSNITLFKALVSEEYAQTNVKYKLLASCFIHFGKKCIFGFG